MTRYAAALVLLLGCVDEEPDALDCLALDYGDDGLWHFCETQAPHPGARFVCEARGGVLVHPSQDLAPVLADDIHQVSYGADRWWVGGAGNYCVAQDWHGAMALTDCGERLAMVCRMDG